MKFELAPARLSIRDKHTYYIKKMRVCDESNNELIDRIKRISKTLNKMNTQLESGRQTREKYRNKVARYKRIYRGGNKFVNDNNLEAVE